MIILGIHDGSAFVKGRTRFGRGTRRAVFVTQE